MCEWPRELNPTRYGVTTKRDRDSRGLNGLPDDIRMITVDRFCDKVIRHNRRNHPRTRMREARGKPVATFREKLEDFGRAIHAATSLAHPNRQDGAHV